MGARALLLAALCVHTLHAHCPRLCDCKWKSGKESVLCPKANLTHLPALLDPGTQLLDLNDNPLISIQKDAFSAAGLLNLQKIYISKCRLKSIDRHAFRKLINLVELDLSNNLLPAVPSHVFDSISELRELKLSGNPIQRILNDAFIHVPQLVRLELSDCKLGTVEARAFNGLENSLEWLKLDRNRLSDVRSSTLTSLQSLHGLELANNPWNCTCRLRPLRDWMLRQNVPYGMPPSCRFPLRLAGKSWDRMELDEFACAPQTAPVIAESKAQEGENVTITCRIVGEPPPKIVWLLRNRMLVNVSSGTGRRSYLIKSRDDMATLTVLGAEPQDAGLYTCAAENLAGRAEAVVKLAVMKSTGNNNGGGVALVAGATVALIILAVCLLLLGYKAAKTKPRQHPTACTRHRSDSYEKIEMNHKLNNHHPVVSNLLENETSMQRNEPVSVMIAAVKKRGNYRHVPSQDTEDEAETYDEDMETPTPTPTTEVKIDRAWRGPQSQNWPLKKSRTEDNSEETDLHIRFSEFREPRLVLTPESSSSCGQQNYNAFNSTDSQNKSNNNIVETMIPPIVPRRHLPPEPKPRNLDTKSNLRLSSITDDQNNFPTEIDKNFPDLLEINSNTSQDIRLLSLQQALAGRQRNEDSFYTLPRKINVKYNHNTKQHRDSDSQSPLLTDSRYGSSGGESSVGSISNRRLSIESYSNFTNSNGNTKSQRSNSFLNLAPSAINRNGPSLPGSPSSATPLLELRGLPRGELTRTPAVPSTPSMPLSYDYHAAQLERFLEEYRSLQEQLCRMKETCESISENRSTSTSRFADAMLFSKCVATPSSGDESNFGKKKPSVSVTAASGAMSAGNLDANNSLSIHGNDVSSISSWMNTNNSSQMKRMGGNTDFYRS